MVLWLSEKIQICKVDNPLSLRIIASAKGKRFGDQQARWWFQTLYRNFHPCLGKIPIWTIIFQMGWLNHQLAKVYCSSKICRPKKVHNPWWSRLHASWRFPHTQVMEQ